MKVLFLPEVENYFFELTEILYNKEYFGFKENAVKYVLDLENDIRTSLITKVKRPAPPFFEKYGKKCYILSFLKVKLHIGTCFLMYIKTMMKLFL